jgi:hypothetical protein
MQCVYVCVSTCMYASVAWFWSGVVCFAESLRAASAWSSSTAVGCSALLSSVCPSAAAALQAAAWPRLPPWSRRSLRVSPWLSQRKFAAACLLLRSDAHASRLGLRSSQARMACFEHCSVTAGEVEDGSRLLRHRWEAAGCSFSEGTLRAPDRQHLRAGSAAPPCCVYTEGERELGVVIAALASERAKAARAAAAAILASFEEAALAEASFLEWQRTASVFVPRPFEGGLRSHAARLLRSGRLCALRSALQPMKRCFEEVL